MTRQQNKFIALMENYTEATNLATIATESNGEANKKMSYYLDSVEGKLNTVKAQISELAQNILTSSMVKTVLDAASAFLELANNCKILIPILLTALTAIALYQGRFVTAIALAALDIASIVGAVTESIAVQETITEETKKQADAEDEVLDKTNSTLDTLNKMLERTKALQTAYEEEAEAKQEQLEYEEKILALQEKEKALADAERKRVKIYRAGKGFVYETDFSEVSKAQKEVAEAKEELKEYEFKNEINAMQELIDTFEKLTNSDADLTKFFNNIGLSIEELGDTADEARKKIKQYVQDYLNSIGVSNGAEYLAYLNGDDVTKANITSGLEGLGIETHHDGGVVGDANAKFTSGALKSDEIITKLQKGETVLTQTGKNNLVKNFANQSVGGNVNIGNVTLPNVTNAEQFVNELKSIGRMSLQRATTHR